MGGGGALTAFTVSLMPFGHIPNAKNLTCTCLQPARFSAWKRKKKRKEKKNPLYCNILCPGTWLLTYILSHFCPYISLLFGFTVNIRIVPVKEVLNVRKSYSMCTAQGPGTVIACKQLPCFMVFPVLIWLVSRSMIYSDVPIFQLWVPVILDCLGHLRWRCGR